MLGSFGGQYTVAMPMVDTATCNHRAHQVCDQTFMMGSFGGQHAVTVKCIFWLQLPQVGLFLFLCRDALSLEQVPMYELERCLAMSRQSLRLQQVMTTLLNTPFQRKRSPSACPPVCVLKALASSKLCLSSNVCFKGTGLLKALLVLLYVF